MARSQEFKRDVLPILSENCFACHGPDEQARQSGLRLDLSEGALATADSGDAAIIPYHAEARPLIERIESHDADLRMPPPESGKELSAEQRQVLRQWIQSGADYELHWSFVPPRAVPPPMVEGVEHPIDRFVQARLAQEGLSPAPLASAATLLRRVSLDLIGLPPTLAEIDAFEAAVAMIQREPTRLRSTGYSAALTTVNVGDVGGSIKLGMLTAMDIRSMRRDRSGSIAIGWWMRLNRDMPFDQFTVEQLAGDLLPESSDPEQTVSQQIATGFHRNTLLNQEGGIDVEQFRIDSVFDRVATTGTVWLGLTIGCAQCHDHKFDPLTQKEYYQFFAFFNNQDEPTLEVNDPRQSRADLKSELKKAEIEVDEFILAHAAKYDAWEQSVTAELLEKLPSDLREGLETERSQRTPPASSRFVQYRSW
ncbi:MAG: DUF1549 domain-containing protein [Pirellulaceae bacterium]